MADLPITSLQEKTTPAVAGDFVVMIDSEDGNKVKKQEATGQCYFNMFKDNKLCVPRFYYKICREPCALENNMVYFNAFFIIT